MYKVCTTIVLLIFILTAQAQTQNAEVKLYFLEDSLKIGMPSSISVSARYNRYSDILFPDSTDNFGDFEYVSRRYFETQTSGATSFDSVIYQLRTFNLDSVNSLSLGLWEIYNSDSIRITSNTDSVYTKFVVPELPDSINSIFLRETADYYRLNRAFNYPYFITGLLIVGILILILWISFGERIKTYFRIRRMTKEFQNYQVQFDKVLNEMNETNRFEKTEKLLVLWKNYMEKLENLPYSKLTTKEISRLKDDGIDKILVKLDKILYSGKESAYEKRSFEDLRSYSTEAFSEKLNHIKNGIST